METAASSAYGWSLHELGFADFTDERLTKRGIDIAARFLQHPQQSIPQSCGDWAATKATYRFFSNDKVQSSHMLDAHGQQVIKRSASLPTILIAQDTTALNLSGRKIAGVGSIGGGTSTGLFVHSGLAIDPNGGIPLGVVTQEIYARLEKTKTPEYKKTANDLPISEKESGRWVETVIEGKKVYKNKHLVFVGDRESDIYEVFAEANKQRVDVLIRTKQNRLLEEMDETEKKVKLFEKVLKGEIITVYETEVSIDHHKTRKATLTIRTSSINLIPSKRQVGHESIAVTVLNVLEENPPDNMEPVHWMLTTTLPVTTAQEAREKVTWYMYRWRIERFHYTLKTGAFNIEELQFETFERFHKAITMYSIVASRVLYTQYYEKEHPEEDAREIFSMEEVTILCLKAKKKPPYQLSVHEAVVGTAKLGGYLARNNDSPPGIKALWIGFQTLQNLVEGMLLGRQAV
jgi:hypothetical protein